MMPILVSNRHLPLVLLSDMATGEKPDGFAKSLNLGVWGVFAMLFYLLSLRRLVQW